MPAIGLSAAVHLTQTGPIDTGAADVADVAGATEPAGRYHAER